MKNINRKLLAAYNVCRRGATVTGPPIHMQVETTNACNLRCSTCHRDLIYPETTMMSFDVFTKIYNDIRPENINVSGLGEPFLNPEIFEMIKYAKSQGSIVNCASNFTRVSGKEEKIVESGIDQIKISIDATDRETFKKIRKVDLYDSLIGSVKEVNRIKAEKGINTPALRFNYALQQDNIDQLEGAIRLAHELGVPGVYVQYLEYIDREDRKEKIVGDITAEKLRDTLLRANSVAEELGISTNLNIWMRDFDMFVNKMGPAEDFKSNDKKCYFPWFSSWVDADGTVRPCPIIPWQRDVACMGNVKEQPFQEIWNNKKFKAFREVLARGERPTGPCRTCIPQSIFNIVHIKTRMLARQK